MQEKHFLERLNYNGFNLAEIRKKYNLPQDYHLLKPSCFNSELKSQYPVVRSQLIDSLVLSISESLDAFGGLLRIEAVDWVAKHSIEPSHIYMPWHTTTLFDHQEYDDKRKASGLEKNTKGIKAIAKLANLKLQIPEINRRSLVKSTIYFKTVEGVVNYLSSRFGRKQQPNFSNPELYKLLSRKEISLTERKYNHSLKSSEGIPIGQAHIYLEEKGVPPSDIANILLSEELRPQLIHHDSLNTQNPYFNVSSLEKFVSSLQKETLKVF